MFKQLKVFVLECEILNELDDVLKDSAFVPTRPQQTESIGWGKAIGERYVHSALGAERVALMREERNVPSAFVRSQAEARLRGVKNGEQPSRREVVAMREAVLLDLLPNAFPKQTQNHIVIDRRRNRVWFDTVTASRVERASNLLRESLGKWRMVPTIGLGDISSALTQWLMQGAPFGFEVGSFAKVVDPREGSTISVSRLSLPEPNIEAYLRDGLRVEQLELTWKDRIRFVLRYDGGLTKIKPTDLLTVEFEVNGEDPESALDAEQHLMVGLFRELIDDLENALLV